MIVSDALQKRILEAAKLRPDIPTVLHKGQTWLLFDEIEVRSGEMSFRYRGEEVCRQQNNLHISGGQILVITEVLGVTRLEVT